MKFYALVGGVASFFFVAYRIYLT